MKVQLIQGYLGPRPERSLFYSIVYPLGLSYIGTALRQDGHDVQVYDPNVNPGGLVNLEGQLEQYTPEVVGISLRNIDNLDYVRYAFYYGYLRDVIQSVRKVCPTVPLLIGGAGFSLFPERIMGDHPELDFGVFLDGEETVVELLRGIDQPSKVSGLYYRDGGEVRFTGPRPHSGVSAVPRPERDLFDISPYLGVDRCIGIQSHRGCYLDCAYCSYPALEGREVRCRPVHEVADEMEHLRETYSVTTVAFVDSVFDLDRTFAKAVCQELIDREIDIRWTANFETHQFDEEWFLLARQAGCKGFLFSPDGATDATMRALGKRCRERDLAEVIRIATKYPDTTFNISLFCGVPGQNWRDIWKLLVTLYRTQYRLDNTICVVNWIRVFPNTDVHRRLLDSGTLSPGAELLPTEVTDHRPLFLVAPGTPRLATPIVRWWCRALNWLRRRRRRAATAGVRFGGSAT